MVAASDTPAQQEVDDLLDESNYDDLSREELILILAFTQFSMGILLDVIPPELFGELTKASSKCLRKDQLEKFRMAAEMGTELNERIL
ncbi:hypothetical protein OAG36_00795 [bacterium]|nr:hypothetical protein [bacterium]